MHLMAVKKPRKRSGFIIYSYFKTMNLQQLKGMKKFYTRCVKEVPFVNERYT